MMNQIMKWSNSDQVSCNLQAYNKSDPHKDRNSAQISNSTTTTSIQAETDDQLSITLLRYTNSVY